MSEKEAKLGAQNVRELVAVDVKRGRGGPRLEELLRDLRAFADGSAAYGLPPTPGAGRNHLVDAYHHAWDCAVFLRQHITDGQASWPEYLRAIDLVAVLGDRMRLEGVSVLGGGEDARREARAHVAEAIRANKRPEVAAADVAKELLKSGVEDWTPSDAASADAYRAEVRAELDRIAAGKPPG